MREGLFSVSILDTSRERLPERNIDGRTYVEGMPGQEYEVEFCVYRDVDGKFPVKSCMAYVYIDGKACDKYLFHLPDDCAGVISNGFECDELEHFRAYEFTTASTATDYKDSPESATGKAMVLFYEVEKCQEPFGDIGHFPVLFVSTPLVEYNYPEKQPSLMTHPGQIKPWCQKGEQDPCNSLATMLIWRRMRDEPDATLTLKCHTANTLNFLEHFHNANRRICSVGTTGSGAEQPCGSAVAVTESKKQAEAPSHAEAPPARPRSTSSTTAPPPAQAPVKIAGVPLPFPGASSKPVNKTKKDPQPVTITSVVSPQPFPGASTARTPVLGEVADLTITGVKRKADDNQERDAARR